MCLFDPQIIQKRCCPVVSDFPRKGVQPSAEMYNEMIEESIEQVFGVVGGAIDFKVLSSNAASGSSIVQVEKR